MFKDMDLPQVSHAPGLLQKLSFLVVACLLLPLHCLNNSSSSLMSSMRSLSESSSLGKVFSLATWIFDIVVLYLTSLRLWHKPRECILTNNSIPKAKQRLAIIMNKVSEELVDTRIIIRVTWLLGLITQRWCVTFIVLLLSLPLLSPICTDFLRIFILFTHFLLSYSSFHAQNFHFNQSSDSSGWSIENLRLQFSAQLNQLS